MEQENSVKRLVKIQAGYQSYEWGKIGASSKVYELASQQSSTQLKTEAPYAELWMGTHVNCPSYAIIPGEEQKTLLSKLLASSPEHYLGEAIQKEYGLSDSLPYLFKVLSVEKALSIQAHPDKTLASQLFKDFPNIYKDPNHKPEMCVALTNYEALCNFSKPAEIVEALQTTPELVELIGNNNIVEQFIEKQSSEALKPIFVALFEASEEQITRLTAVLISRITAKAEFSKRDSLVLRLNKQYPNDIGIFVSYLLNYFEMQPGDCLVMGANEPHAYISGDCIECMAASDNVVRAGLTPKFKDKNTLCSMLTYEMKSPAILNSVTVEATTNSNVYLYQPSEYKDFSCYRVAIQTGDQAGKLTLPSGAIFLVTAGQGQVQLSTGDQQQISKGDTYFIAAQSEFWFLNAESLEVFVCFCVA